MWLSACAAQALADLNVEITIDEIPRCTSRPWTVTQEFRLSADDELLEYVCNENNRDLPHLVGK